MTLFGKNITKKQKKIHNSTKTYDTLKKYRWAWPMRTPFLASWAQKKQYLEMLPFLLEISGLQHKFLALIKSPNISIKF